MFSCPLETNPGVELQDNMATPCFIFGGTFKLFPKAIASFYIHTSNGFQFLHNFVNPCYFLSFFIIVIQVGVKWSPILVLMCITPQLIMLGVFMCHCELMCFLGEMPIRSLCPFLIGLYVLSLIELLSSSYTLHACVLSCFSHVQIFVTLWTVANQAPLSTGFSRQEYWSGLPCPPPGDLPDPGIEQASLNISCFSR